MICIKENGKPKKMNRAKEKAMGHIKVKPLLGITPKNVEEAIDIALKEQLDEIEKWFDEQRKNNNLWRWHNDEIGDKLLEHLRAKEDEQEG